MAVSEPGGSAAVSVTFKDVTVAFPQKEWEQLDPAQRNLHKDVMLENCSHLASMGYQAAKPDMISKLEKGEEPWLGKGKTPRQGGPNETARPKQTEANGMTLVSIQVLTQYLEVLQGRTVLFPLKKSHKMMTS